MSEPLEYVIVGRVLRPWGVRGEVKVEVMTDFPERFEPGRTLYIDHVPYTIEQSGPLDDGRTLKLTSVDSRQDAQKLRGQYLEVPASELASLPEDSYYHFQLVGMQVYDTDGNLLGHITEVVRLVSNDVYVMQAEGQEVLLPAIEDVVKEIDVDRGRITIEVIPGLMD